MPVASTWRQTVGAEFPPRAARAKPDDDVITPKFSSSCHHHLFWLINLAALSIMNLD